MQINSYHTRMLITESEPINKASNRTGGSTTSGEIDSSDNTESDTSDKVSISNLAMKKSQETMSAEDKLPAHIKRLKALIKEIKIQIKEQQQKLAELEQSNVSNEVKDATRELYLEQLMSLQSALASTSSALEQAIEAAGITDPAVLMAAIL